MVLDHLNSSNLEQLALKGLTNKATGGETFGVNGTLQDGTLLSTNNFDSWTSVYTACGVMTKNKEGQSL